ncbi:hypothetical protein AB9F29_04310 [Falsihalocynthiibacter sp. S25ZX9]|uniref:hypothetical protein n=1 Tax=Falsihalocynthiibacter sp. S25ZX9 TaxID=3240870 RepID=UPI003510AD4B
MIFTLARQFFFAFVGLTVIYLISRWFAASLRREDLEEEFDEEVKEGDRDAFIEEGMERYRKSFRRKALVLIYVIPLVLYVIVLYLINFY